MFGLKIIQGKSYSEGTASLPPGLDTASLPPGLGAASLPPGLGTASLPPGFGEHCNSQVAKASNLPQKCQ